MTSPSLLDVSQYNFRDLVDVSAFARMLESFFHATGIPNGVVDASGELLSLSTGVNACTEFHRVQPQAAERCRESNLAIMRDLREGQVAGGLCKNGLMDYATPVVIEGRQLATLFLGQVLHEPPDLKFFRAQAAQFGFDEKAYLESIKAIPVVDKAHVQDHMAVMVEMAQMLAASGFARLRQATLERDISTHVEKLTQLEDILDFSPVAIGWLDGEGRIEHINREFTQLFGYTLDELPDLETGNRLLYPDERYRETVVIPWIKAAALARQNNTTPPELEADITCKNGAVRRVVIRVSSVGNHRMVSFTDITERKRAGQALRQSEHFLDTLLNAIPVPVFYKDREGRYLGFNKAYETFFGATRDQLIGKSVFDISPPELAQIYHAKDTELFESGEMQQYESQVKNTHGVLRDVVFNKTTFTDIHGNLILAGVISDITERKRMELQLAARERELRSLVENIPDNIARYTPDARHVYMSPVLERVNGKPKESFLGRTPMECFPDGRYAEYEQRIRAVAASGTPDTMEMDVPMPDGETQCHLIRFVAEHDDTGAVTSVLTVGTDITANKRAEQSLKQALEFTEGIINAIPDLLFEVDLNGKYLNVWTQDPALLAAQKEALLGNSIRVVLLPDAAEIAMSAIAEADRKGSSFGKVIRIPLSQGEGWSEISVSKKPGSSQSDRHFIVLSRDVTERKRLQDDLTDSRNFLNRIIDTIADPIFVKDRQHRWIYVNEACCRLIGGTRKVLIGKSDFDYFPEHEARAFWEGDELVFTGGKEFSREEEITNERGEKRYIFTRKTTFTDIHGNLVLVGVISDITERKRMELQLAARERELRSLVENIPDNIARYTTDARFAYVNPQLERVNGKPKEYFLGRTPTECFPDQNPAEYERRIRAVAASGVGDMIEISLATPDGETQYHLIRFVAETNEMGAVDSVLAIGTDITERKRMELSLAAREREFRTLAQNLPDVMVRFDRDARLVYANPKFEAMFGVRSEEAHGKTPTQVPGMPEAEYYEQEVRKVVETGTAAELEHTVVTADGSQVWGLVHVTPEFDDTGQVKYVQMVTRDITRRWVSEQRMQAHGAILEMLARGADLSAILNAIVQQLESEDKTARCSVLLLDAEGKHLLTGAAPNLPEFYTQAIHGIEIGMGVGSCGTAAAIGERVVVEDILTHDYWKPYLQLAQKAELRACWSEPILSSHGKVLGAFAIYHGVPKRPQAEDLERIAFAANLAAVAIESRYAYEELERRAYTDYLTGLANRRYFLEQAEKELSRAQRYNLELSILMLDIDHFKQVNDTCGHKVGDLVLQKLSEICRASLRDIDIVGRIGGEEFAVLLPETGSEQSMQTAERMRAALAAAQVVQSDGLPLHFTASFGVTTLVEKETNIDILLNQADQALYEAKNTGRNRVCKYRSDSPAR